MTLMKLQPEAVVCFSPSPFQTPFLADRCQKIVLGKLLIHKRGEDCLPLRSRLGGGGQEEKIVFHDASPDTLEEEVAKRRRSKLSSINLIVLLATSIEGR